MREPSRAGFIVQMPTLFEAAKDAANTFLGATKKFLYTALFTGSGGGGMPFWMGNGWLSRKKDRRLPNTQIDFEEVVQDPTANASVATTIRWINDRMRKAWLEVRRPSQEQGSPDTVENKHKALGVLARPNPAYTAAQLWSATRRDYLTRGTAFWRKVRNERGEVIQLWHVPAKFMRACWPEDGTEFITHWIYTPNGTEIVLPLKDVVVFRDGIDVETRMGIGRTEAALPHIAALNEQAIYSYTLMKKLGCLGVVVSLKQLGPGVNVPPDLVKAFNADLTNRITGDGRFGTISSSMPVDVQTIGRSPEEMALDKTHQIPESTVAASIGIPTKVLGLASGMHDSTYNNVREAKEDAWETIESINADEAEALTLFLLPDFDPDPQAYLAWNYSQIGAMQESKTRISNRIIAEWEKDLLTLNEALENLQRPLVTGPEGKMRFTELMVYLQRKWGIEPQGSNNHESEVIGINDKSSDLEPEGPEGPPKVEDVLERPGTDSSSSRESS